MTYELKFCYESLEPWSEEHECNFDLPDKKTVTLEDVGEICWPDDVGEYVATKTGAINSHALISVTKL